MHVVALLYVLLLVLLPTQANLLEIHYFADTDDTCSSQPTTFEYASVGSCQYGYKVAGSSTGDGVVRYVYTTVDSTTVRLTTHAAGDTACTLPTLTVDVKLSTCTVDPSGTYVSYVSVSPSSPVPTPAFEYGAGSITTYPLCLNTNENQAITTRTVSNPERCSISEDDGRPTRQLCNATHIFTLKYNRTYAATECQGAGYLTGLTNMVDKSCVSGPDSVFSCLPVRTSNPTPTPDPTIPSNTWIMTERIYQDVASSAGGSATLSNGVTAFAFINTFVLVSGYAEDGSRAFHISPSNANFGSSVSVASLSDINGFVVVWLSTGNGTIHGRVYNNDGTARSDILTLFSAPTDSSVSNPYVTSLGTSRFGVVFSASSTTFNSDWIYGAVHNYAGEVLSRSIVCQSNATYSCAGGQPSISSFGAKGLLLAWLHFNPTTPDDISISGCLYNFEMVRLTNNVFPLSASEVATRRQLSLVYLSGDNIAAAWSRAVISPPASITSYEIIGCVFNPETNPMGCYNGNLRLHAVTTRDQVRPRISAVNPSEYLAVWVDTNFGVQGTIVNQNALPYTQGLLLRGSSSQVPFPTTLSANDNQVAFQLSFLSGSKIHTRFATYYKIGTNDRKKNDHGFFSFHNRVFIAILVGAGPLIIGLIVLFFVVLFRKKDDNEITNTNDPSFKALSNKSQSSWDSKSSSPSSPSPSSYQPAAVITSSPSSNNNFTTSYSSPNTETKSETSTPFTSSYNDGKSSTMKKPKRDTVDEEIAKLASFEMPLIMQRSATPVSETNDSKAIELDTFSTPTKKVESVDSRNSSFEEPPPAYSSSPPPYSSTPPDAAAPAELSSIEPEITSDSPPSFSSLNQTIDDIFNTPSKPTEDNNNNNDSASKTDEIDAMADVDSTIAQMNDIVNQMNNMQNWLAN